MSQPLVSFRQINKTYDGKGIAVADLNLDVSPGEFLTLLGPSGSGKTTTLMMLAGFEAPSTGDILVNGRSVTSLLPQQRNFGVVFQSYALFPRMTVAENIAFPLRVRGMAATEVRERVERAISVVHLSGLQDRLPRQLSGGQQQRVALARATVFDPEVVLMDEPLGALDRQLRQHMQHEIRRLHKELGITVLYVTHDQEEALTMSDRIVVFNEGTVQQAGPPEDIYERPDSAFVARFIGENNSLAATVVAVEGQRCIAEIATGERVIATPVGNTRPGSQVEVCVRPENIIIANDAGPGDWSIAGDLADLTYLGQQLRAQIRVGDGQLVDVLFPAESKPLLIEAPKCRLHWKVEHARAFPSHHLNPVLSLCAE